MVKVIPPSRNSLNSNYYRSFKMKNIHFNIKYITFFKNHVITYIYYFLTVKTKYFYEKIVYISKNKIRGRENECDFNSVYNIFPGTTYKSHIVKTLVFSTPTFLSTFGTRMLKKDYE